MEMIWIWLGVFIIALVIEILTLELSSIWFSLSALVSLALAGFKVGRPIQLIVFFALSILMLVTMRRWAHRFLKKSSDGKTNLDLFMDGEHLLITPIKNGIGGTIKINGVVWSVKSDVDKNLKVTSKVVVLDIEGNQLIVVKAPTENQ